MDEIRRDYEALKNLLPDSDGAAKRRRGFAFERLLNALFSYDCLDPRAGYRPAGEQIDGSIYLDGRVYLVEAKWHVDPLPASTLYQFKGKVDGKLAGTLGIFISVSGYAEGAVDALILGKDLNIILVDQIDLDSAILRGHGIKNILKLKIRKAAEEGVIYFPIMSEIVTAKETRAVEVDELSHNNIMSDTTDSISIQPITTELLIVCEGQFDFQIIGILAERILANANSNRTIRSVIASGKLAIPRVANSLQRMSSSASKVLIVVDGDGDPLGSAAMLSDALKFSEWTAVIPNPSIEVWLELDPTVILGREPLPAYIAGAIAATELDIEVLRARDEEFARFYNAVLDI